MQSPCAAACRAVPAEQWMVPPQANTMVGGAACRAVPVTCAMMLAHMVMDGHRANANRVAGMGSRQKQADKAWQGRHRPL